MGVSGTPFEGLRNDYNMNTDITKAPSRRARSFAIDYYPLNHAGDSAVLTDRFS